MIHLYLSGESPKEIGRKAEISPKTVIRHLKKSGIQMRTLRESMKIAGHQGKLSRIQNPASFNHSGVMAEMYNAGSSIPEISVQLKIPQSTVRYWLLKKGVVLRSRNESLKIASEKGKFSSRKGTTREFTQEWKDNIRKARIKWGHENAKGVSLKPSGYFEMTTGENKGRPLHDVIMEEHIGRKLAPNEVVHHKDKNKQNNAISNLEVLTNSEHARLHATENHIFMERNEDGTWKKSSHINR